VNQEFRIIPQSFSCFRVSKFALAVELWDEVSSNPDEIPVTEEQLNELDQGVLKIIAKIQIKSSPGKMRRQGSFPVGVNGGCPSSLQNGIFKRRTTGLKSTVESLPELNKS